MFAHLYFRSYNLSSAASSAGFSAKSSAGFFAKSSAGFSATSFFGAAAALAGQLILRIRAVRTVLISVSYCSETGAAGVTPAHLGTVCLAVAVGGGRRASSVFLRNRSGCFLKILYKIEGFD